MKTERTPLYPAVIYIVNLPTPSKYVNLGICIKNGKINTFTLNYLLLYLNMFVDFTGTVT